MQITGACHCGAIRYQAEVDPTSASVCHCTDCQILSGTAFRVSIRALLGSFQILSGTPKLYTKTAESGRLREQAFCENCGAPIYATSPGPEPRAYSIRAGTIDQRDQLRPNLQSWSRSKLCWLDELTTIPSIEKQA